MKTLLELERIAATDGKRSPQNRPLSRRERRQRDRELIRQMKRAANGSQQNIQTKQGRKDFGGRVTN